MKKLVYSILLTSAIGALSVNAKQIDCLALSDAVAVEVSADKSQVLEVVSSQVAAAPGCACEIVKAAIKASEGDAPTVAAITGAAITEVPDQMRLISQCAIAAAPDAIGAIQALLATLDPNSGKRVSDSKDAKAAAVTEEVAGVDWNPLDFPGDRDSPVRGFNNLPGPQGDKAPPVINSTKITDPNP